MAKKKGIPGELEERKERKERELIVKMLDVLEPLSPANREKVLHASCILLDIPWPLGGSPNGHEN